MTNTSEAETLSIPKRAHSTQNTNEL